MDVTTTGQAAEKILHPPKTRTEYAIPRAAMSAENLQAIWRHSTITVRTRAHEISPFTAVVCEEDEARVQFQDQVYDLISIDNLPTKRILDYAKKRYGDRWEKRFAEDLVRVLDGMGHSPGDTVKLVLLDPRSGKERIVDNALMTQANRQAVWRARKRPLRHDKLSPFTAVQVHKDKDKVHVEFEGQFYELMAIDDLSTERILDYTTKRWGQRDEKRFGKRGEKRFAEDLVTVLEGIGHSPGNTVELTLRDLKSGKERTVARAPMTHANRQAIKRAHKNHKNHKNLLGNWVRQGTDNVLIFSADGTVRIVDPGQGELQCIYTVGHSKLLLHDVPEEFVGGEFQRSFSRAFSFDQEGARQFGGARFLRKR